MNLWKSLIVAIVFAHSALSLGADSRVLCVLKNRIVDTANQRECEKRQQEEQSAISDFLDDYDISAKAKVLDLDILEALTLGLRYKFEAYPSSGSDNFVRIDRYVLETGIGAGELLDDLPLHFGMEREAEIIFAQQFATGPEARSVRNAYLPKMLPLTAGKALKLKPGDYSRFSANMNLVAGVGQTFPLVAEVLQGRVGFNTLIGGEFQIQVFRLDNSQVRLRIIGENKRTRELEARFGASKKLDIVGVNLLDRRIVSVLDLDQYIRVVAERSKEDLFLVDYTLDLSDPRVAEAYDQVFSSLVRFENFSVKSAWRNKLDVKSIAAGNIETLDILYREQAVASLASPTVSRNLKATNESVTTLRKFKLGLKAFKRVSGTVYRENFITHFNLDANGEEVSSRYLFPTFSKTTETKIGFGRFDKDLEMSSDALFIADENGDPLQFVSIGFKVKYEDSDLNTSEYAQFRQLVSLLLPPEAERKLVGELQDSDWLEFRKRNRARMDLNYFFREAAFTQLVEKGYGNLSKLKNALYDFVIESLQAGDFPLYSGDLDKLVANYKSQLTETHPSKLRTPTGAARRIIEVLWGRELNNIATKLAKALSPPMGENIGKGNRDRLDAFTSLRDSSTYHKIGSGFWIYLLRDNDIDIAKSLYLELSLRARDSKSVTFTFGESQERELYHVVQFVESVLNDDEEDMLESGLLDELLQNTRIVVND